MAQRQFRSDDTSHWNDSYGSGSDGALNIAADTTDSQINVACSGAVATTSLSATSASFAAGQLILIIQTQGSGAGNWELNKISSYSTGTITTTYALTNTYDVGAQVLVMKQYTTVNVASTKTLSAPAWDGVKGGILAFFASQSVNGPGTASVSAKGFRGGAGQFAGGQPGGFGFQGESDTGGGSQSTAANGTAGGGGQSYIPADGSDATGAGGGLATVGTSGQGVNGNTSFGQPGAVKGSSGLTVIYFGGAGGGGGAGSGESAGDGGIAGGLILIITPNFGQTNPLKLNLNGGVGGGVQYSPGGGGAAGSALIKGQNIALGTLLSTATGGAGGHGSVTGVDGGTGGNGYIHADYGATISGTTNPTLDSRQDSALNAASPSASQSPSSSPSPSASVSASPSRSASPSSSTSPSPSSSQSPSASISPSIGPGSGLFSKQASHSLPTSKVNLSLVYNEEEEEDVIWTDGNTVSISTLQVG